MSKAGLEKMSCKELREEAKKLNISGRWDMTKSQLVEEIASHTEANEKEDTSEEVRKADKLNYIKTVECGTLVAFKVVDGKHAGRVKSAKVIHKSTINEKLEVETAYGERHVISFDDVLWVKTGTRWPKGVYKLLKGLVDNGEENNTK